MAQTVPLPVESSPEKKLTRRPVFWILLVVVVGGIVTAVLAMTGGVNHVTTQKHTVVYSVTGTSATTNLSYSTVQGGNGQKGLAEEAGASVPWTKTITVSGLFTGFTLSAENGSKGSITCTITADGKVLDTNTASGPYAVASCESTGST